MFNKSFTDQLSSIKSAFQSAHDKTLSLIENMNSKIQDKETTIKELQDEIKSIEETKEQANKFITGLKSILA